MEIQRYNWLKAAIERKQNDPCFNSTKLEQKQTRSNYVDRRICRTQFNISTVSRWMINNVQLSEKQLYEIACHLDIDVRELLISSKN